MSSRDHCLFGTVLCKNSNNVSVQVSELSLRDCGMLKNFKLSLLENASSLSILSSISMEKSQNLCSRSCTVQFVFV